jgi:hypothetical protein
MLVILNFLISTLGSLFTRFLRVTLASCAILLAIFSPARLRAQATNPAYIAQMPSVDRDQRHSAQLKRSSSAHLRPAKMCGILIEVVPIFGSGPFSFPPTF